jgi:hypothetical protein
MCSLFTINWLLDWSSEALQSIAHAKITQAADPDVTENQIN